MEEAILVAYCKASDYDATTGTCVAPFFGPASSFPPPIDVVEGLLLTSVIGGAWGIGFMIRQARRAATSGV